MTFELDYIIQTLDGRLFGLKKGAKTKTASGRSMRVIQIKILKGNREDFKNTNVFILSKIRIPGFLLDHDELAAEETLKWAHIKKGVSLECKYSHGTIEKTFVTEPILYLYRLEK